MNLAVAWPDGEHHLHLGAVCGVEFLRHIGKELNLARLAFEPGGDYAIAFRTALRSCRSIEILVDETREIPKSRIAKHKPLGKPVSRPRIVFKLPSPAT